MATTVARLQAILSADTSRFDKAMDQSDRKSEGFASKLGGIAKMGALAGGAAGVGALVYTLKTGIGEWTESQKVAAQTEAVIKSTGGSARVTAGHVSDLATAIMKKSGIDDEAIASGENLLLTFTNVRNEVGKGNDIFDQATSIMGDMSTALGQDMKTSALQLGKALNDPVKGVGALRRVGVSFTDAQKKMIERMVKSGDTMKAQKIIVGELNKEFGGSAEALGKTLPGQINIAKESFNNFAGDLVGKLVPILTDLGNWLRKHWPEISAVIKRAWEEDIKPTFEAFIELGKAIAGVIIDNWETIGPVVKTVATIIENQIRVIVDIMKILAALLRGDWSAAWAALKDAIGRILENIELLIRTWLTVAVKLLTGIGNAMKNALVAGLTGIGNAAWDVINNIKEKIVEKAAAVAGWGEDLGTRIKNNVVDGLKGIGGAVWGIITNIGSFIVDKAEAVAGWGLQIGKGILNGIVAGIKGVGGAIAGAASGLANQVGHALVSVINGVIGRMNSALEFTIPLPFGRSFKVDPPDIPAIGLAEGGIVTRPTLALVGERGPEAVIPLGGGGQPIVVQLVADSRVLAEVLFDPMRDKSARFKQQNGRAAFG